jgi:hypothetical protein
MIKTKLRVEHELIAKMGKQDAVNISLNEWNILPWIRYLREHGTVKDIQYYRASDFYTDTYELFWELPPERETWFYLKFNDEFNSIKRLT